jgi:hypothetical protein
MRGQVSFLPAPTPTFSFDASRFEMILTRSTRRNLARKIDILPRGIHRSAAGSLHPARAFWRGFSAYISLWCNRVGVRERACLAKGCAAAYVGGSLWEAIAEAMAYRKVVEMGTATESKNARKCIRCPF